jgi:lipoprotein-anchoring transpeptidase ErfK/SrfK
MRRTFASAQALSIAACAIPLLIATANPAASQLLDPGWQLGYSARPLYAGGGIVPLLGGGGPVVAPMVAYQQPAPLYYPPAPQARAYVPAPVYYRAGPQPRVRMYQRAPVSYQPMNVPQVLSYASAPVYYRQASPPAPAYQVMSASYQQAASPQRRAVSAAPQYTGSVQPPPDAPQPAPRPSFFSLPMPQPNVAQPAPVQNVAQVAPQPAPQRSFFQLAPLFQPLPPPGVAYNAPPPAYAPSAYGDMAHPMIDPRYERQLVEYKTDEKPGTIVVDTAHHFLYLVEEDGRAMRYGIGVGREGFTWSGVNEISSKREWPDWRPPNDMLERRPDLPRYMSGGPDNPLGARALYIGSTLYRIHGSNEPWTIGTNVSSGCIRLRNADVIDLYERVKVGSKVIVL